MEPETQKIISLLEEVVSVQKASQNTIAQLNRKIDAHRSRIMIWASVSFLALAYAVIISLLYFKVIN